MTVLNDGSIEGSMVDRRELRGREYGVDRRQVEA